MGFQSEKQQTNTGRDENLQPQEEVIQEPVSYGMPNSFMLSMPLPPPGLPNSVMREMLAPQIPAAEEEADRLSAGVRYGSPNTVRRQMGDRLGADFSFVRFHSGPDSIRRNEAMGSRAYTRGNDVYFGRGGYQPSLAAHELIHTVQQGAIPGRVSQSVPTGTIQRDPNDDLLSRPRSNSVPSRRPAAALHRRNSSAQLGIQQPPQGVPQQPPQGVPQQPPQGVPQQPPQVVPQQQPQVVPPQGNQQQQQQAPVVPQGNLVVPQAAFNLDPQGRKISRWRMSRKVLNQIMIQGHDQIYWMAEQYKHDYPNNFLDANGNQFNPQAVSGPINYGLNAAQAAVNNAAGGQGGGPGAGGQGNGQGAVQAPAPQQGAQPKGNGWKNAKEIAGWTGFAGNIVSPTDKALQLGGELDRYLHPPTISNEIINGKEVEVETSNAHFNDAYKSIAPYAGMTADALGFTAGAIQTVTGIHDVIKNGQKVKAGASHADWVTSLSDTASAAASTGARGLSFAKNFIEAGGGTANFGDWIPGLSVATGGFSALSGGIQTFRGGKSWYNLNQQINAINTPAMRAQAAAANQGGITDQQKLLQIMNQGKRVAKINTASGVMKTISGGLTAAGGIATLSGAAAPIGLALSALGGAVSAFKFAFEKFKKRSLRADVVGEEYGIDWKKEMKDVRTMVDHYNDKMSLRDKDVREIILKAHNAAGKTRTESFAAIKKNRARYLLDHVRNNTPFAAIASAVIEALGVHKRGGSFAAGAEDLLAEKLG